MDFVYGSKRFDYGVEKKIERESNLDIWTKGLLSRMKIKTGSKLQMLAVVECL